MIFGKSKDSNSSLADDTHKSVTHEEKWERLSGYPSFNVNRDNDGDWDIAKCSICELELDYDNWNDHDTYYIALELHELRHSQRSLKP